MPVGKYYGLQNKKTMLCSRPWNHHSIRNESRGWKEGQIPAQHLMNIIKRITPRRRSCWSRQQSWVKISSGKAQFKIAGISGRISKLAQSEFQFQNIHRDTLFTNVEKTAYAICTDEMRYNLSSSLLRQKQHKVAKNHKSGFHRRTSFITIMCIFGQMKPLMLIRCDFSKKRHHELWKTSFMSSSKEVQIAVQKEQQQFIDNIFLTMKLVVESFGPHSGYTEKQKKTKTQLISFLQTHFRRVTSIWRKIKMCKIWYSWQRSSFKSKFTWVGWGRRGNYGRIWWWELTIGFNAKYVMDVFSSVQWLKLF